MEEVKVNIPDGYKIDIENSDLNKGIIIFKQKELTYDELCMEIKSQSEMIGFYVPTNKRDKVKAILKLIKTAYYLNDGWEPDWTDATEPKYSFCLNYGKINIECSFISIDSICYFKSRELTEKAIEILGKDTIYLALS